MYNPDLVQDLIDSQSSKIEQAKEQVKSLLSLLENSTIKLQMSDEAISSVVVAAAIAEKKSFRDRIISEVGCNLKTYFLALKKAAIRIGIEDVDVDLSSSKREILIEEYVVSHPEYEADFKDIVKEIEEA